MKVKLFVPVSVVALPLSFSVALVALALALPLSGQPGAARGGSMGSVGHRSGFAESSGLKGSPGFSGPSGITRQSAPLRPAAPIRPTAAFRPEGVTPGHPPYRPGVGDPTNGWDHNQGHGGDWGCGNKHVGFVFGNHGWPFFPNVYSPYPFVINPGFYHWSLPGDDPTGGQVGAAGSYAPNADYNGAYNTAPPEPNYSVESYPEPSEQGPAPSASRPAYLGAVASSTAPGPQEALTLIFKNGRGPEKIQNYIMTANSLTNLDQQRYEKIPMDEIDIAATEQFNRERGVDFWVPESTRD